jgi:mono/diheme cytochrome c family protein
MRALRVYCGVMASFSRVLVAWVGLLGALGTAPGCKRQEIAGSTRAEAKHLFDSICAKCHGADGKGGVPAAEGQPAPRNFCDAKFHAERSDADLKKAIREGKGPMPPFAALFDETQTALLVEYIRGFNPKR